MSSIFQTPQTLNRLFQRFPLVIIDTVVGTITWIDCSAGRSDGATFNLSLVCLLGFPVLTAATLIVEQINRKHFEKFLFYGSAVVLLLVYYFSLPIPQSPDDILTEQIIRAFLFNIAVYLLLIIVPFLTIRDINKLWQYNKKLVQRFIITFVYSAILYIGLVLLISLIRYLFDVAFSGHFYFQVWIAVVGIFSTWVFLGGVPKISDVPHLSDDYPKLLKLLTQGILLPLLGIFTVIIYLYLIKIISTQIWPKWGVSGWILGYAIFGLVVFLLSYPLWENQRNYRSVFKIFYILLFPLLIVMLGALWVRLSAYGFTVNRLLVFLLGVWFVPISILNLYFLVKKQRGKIIIFVPFSLIVTLLLFSLGPWSIFNLSRQNQFQRLEGLLRKNNILVDGEIKKSNQTVASKDIAEIESVFRYLSKTHGLQNQRVWLDKWIKTIPSEENFFEKSSWGQTHLTMRQLGLNQSFPAWFIFKTDANSFTTAGYDYVLLISQYNDQEIRSFLINQKEYKLVPDLNNSKIQITKENQLIFKIDLLQKITQLAQITKTNNLQEIILPPDDLTFEISNKYGAMKLCVSQLEIRINDEQKMELTNFEGLVLLKLKV